MKTWLRLLSACVPLACVLSVMLHGDEPKSPMPQKLCPLTLDPINRQFHVDYEGKRVYVCCPHCVETVKANPKKYIRQLEAEGITLEPAPK